MHINFRYQNSDYSIDLVPGGKSDFSVTMNHGKSYALLGDKAKLKTAHEILSSLSLDSVTSSDDLKERLSLRPDITLTVGLETLAPQGKGAGMARVNRYIDALKKSDFFSGLVVVASGDKVIRKEAIMPQGVEQKPFTTDTPFNILSIGKLFTTVAVMQLVEKGAIRLDQPIKDLLEEDDYKLKVSDPVYQEGVLAQDDLKALKEDSKITVQHLLTHTAGLRDKHYDPSRIGKYEYSNLGFQYLARIVANQTGMFFVDYVKENIMQKSGMEKSIGYLDHPPDEISFFSNHHPSGQAVEVKSRIPSPDGNGCFWMTGDDLLKFAQAFSENRLVNKERILKQDAAFDNRALGFQVEGNRAVHPGSERGASSGLCIINDEEPVTLICLSNFSEGNNALPEMWDAYEKETGTPFHEREAIRWFYQTIKEGKVLEALQQMKPGQIDAVMTGLKEEGRDDLLTEIVRCLTPAQKQAMIQDAYVTMKKELENVSLYGGALLVNVVGVKGAEPIALGKRSAQDPAKIDENTVGRTGSGAKLWAALLTTILTNKYPQFIQMEDSLEKFAPDEVLKKFSDAEGAKKITVEGIIAMMAGLEYEMPKVSSLSSVDQCLEEVKEGSIKILFDPQDRINFYTNNIGLITLPIEKAYKKILAAKMDQEQPVPGTTLKLRDLVECQTPYIEGHYVYDLLDKIVPQVDYAEIMRREFFAPLGMERSSFKGRADNELDITFKDNSFKPPEYPPLGYGCGFGRTTLADAAKLAKALSDGGLLSSKEFETVFRPHGHYPIWGLGGVELSCGGKVVDKGGSLDLDQYSFWVDRQSGVGLTALCNCGLRPEKILNDFKEKVERINYPPSVQVVKEIEGAELGIPLENYLVPQGPARQLFEGSRGRITLHFDYDKEEKGTLIWSGTPLEVEKKGEEFQVTTPGRFQGIAIKKIAREKHTYLAVGATSFVEKELKLLPKEEEVKRAVQEFPKLKGVYKNEEHDEWGRLHFDVQGDLLLAEGVPQAIIEVQPNALYFNGHDRQPPDKMFRFVRQSENDPWRLQVLDYSSRRFIEERTLQK